MKARFYPPNSLDYSMRLNIIGTLNKRVLALQSKECQPIAKFINPSPWRLDINDNYGV